VTRPSEAADRPPRPPLEHALDAPDRKARYVRRLFETIAPRYDLITRVLSFGRDQLWKRQLLTLAGVSPADRVLDLACGTGDIAIAAAARGAKACGLDIAPRMIALAQQKSRDIYWLVGDMLDLPFADASFDVVTTGYGLRNVVDLPKALAEIRRVLRPGGRLCALDFDRPERRLTRAIYLRYLTTVGSALGWALHRDGDTYRYIPASIRRYPGARGVVRLMETAGFTAVRHVPVLGGLMAIHVAMTSSTAPRAERTASQGGC
jgi:demethylmenaquinone methyltransferase/2-methoxy-6-polyprenyl-1,4-benzoquinol methylase